MFNKRAEKFTRERTASCSLPVDFYLLALFTHNLHGLQNTLLWYVGEQGVV